MKLRPCLAVLLVVALAACTPVMPARPTLPGGRHPWTIPNTLRVASGLVPRTLNPLLATQTIEASLARLTTSILVQGDEHGNLVPGLARAVPTLANGGISRDGLTVTYHLRPHVRWHDGVPFTSHDVAFTFAQIMNPDNDIVSRHGYDDVARVDTPDPLPVVFHLKQRFAPFTATVFGDSDSPYGIVPAHLLARYPNLNDVPYNAAPVGTGPFKIVRWVRGDRIEFVRNNDFYGGRPKIERIIWRFVQDENTITTLLRTHEIDWFFEGSGDAYKTLKELPDTRIVLQAVNGFQSIMFNTRPGRPGNDRALRRAIAMAIDKRHLVSTLTYGAGAIATADLPSFMWAFDPAVRSLPYDPSVLRALLASRGYSAVHPLTLDLVYEQSQLINTTVAVQLQAILRPLGIALRVHPMLSSVIYAGWGAHGTLARGDFDLANYTWVAGIDPDDSAQFTCINRPPAGYDYSYYCSPAMDAAQRVALASYDLPARKKAYARIESLLVADAPLVFFWWFRNVQALNPDIKGFDPNPATETWDIANWSI